MVGDQHPLVDEDANDGDTSEAGTVAYQDDSTSMTHDSTSLDVNTFDDNSDNDIKVYSDTSQDTLNDTSEPAASMYSKISDEDQDGNVIPIVISEDELIVTCEQVFFFKLSNNTPTMAMN